MGTERVLSIEEMVQRFAFLGRDLPKAVFVGMVASSHAMLTSVVKKVRGDYLNVDTGRGWKSFEGYAKADADSIRAIIDTDVIHMKAHEEGFHGTVQVRQHTAEHRGRILAVDIKSRAVARRARPTKREIGRGAWIVRAHTMKMNIRARRFMRDTVNQQFDPTAGRVERAIVIAATTGQLPTPGQLLALG